jgi:hypothetical protein
MATAVNIGDLHDIMVSIKGELSELALEGMKIPLIHRLIVTKF